MDGVLSMKRRKSSQYQIGDILYVKNNCFGLFKYEEVRVVDNVKDKKKGVYVITVEVLAGMRANAIIPFPLKYLSRRK